MHLEGQYERRARPDAGYAMAVLLAGIAIMGIVWTMVVPVWKQQVQREKEAELIFRAGQYARAVALYQRKYANAFPPSVDVLLREKFLRKKYLDPLTNREFRYLSPLELQALPGLTTTTTPGFPNRPGTSTTPTRPGGSSGAGATSPGNFGQPGNPSGAPGSFGSNALGPNGPAVGPQAGIAAVVSRSSAASIKVFKNRRQYNQWIVTVQDVMPRSAAGTPQPGQQPGLQPGQTSVPFGGAPGSTSPGFPTRPNP
jgi:type II secretory pathway pseudopilin PulG